MSGKIVDIKQLRHVSPLLRHSTRIEQIHKGYSSDKKYIVYDGYGRPQCILRSYSIDQDANKRLEYNGLQTMAQHDVKCSRPLEIGVLPEYGIGYMIVSYIEGNDAAEELPLLTDQEQFDIGVQAGKELRKIHQAGCPEPMPSWHDRMLTKHRNYRTAYAGCGVAIRNDASLLAFIDRHLDAMQDRPNLFQHDDYHVGNLIVRKGQLSGIIDFNRYEWGDPIHEFVKVGIFSAEVSVPFSVGQIQGYHNFSEPDETFWRLYALYLGMTLISSVVWILKVKPEELDIMMQKIQKVMDDHDNFASTVPKWYRQQAFI
ncbi:aminoglycoside phosphotransferase family protein [Paenibacillaceae bacterium]|nr:aminoglycoside phosphotransferase family protein [Paenibacillaceae bacterium]